MVQQFHEYHSKLVSWGRNTLATVTKEINKLVDHLFRHESGKLIAVLTKVFGPDQLELVEDVVQDALIEAMQNWMYRGIPNNPSGWLYRVAKNKAINRMKQGQMKNRNALLASEQLTGEPQASDEAFFSEKEIQDDQLRMIFTCCHPAITPDSQIALALKTLCGFSTPEIASAFLTPQENINKRLVRARKVLREQKIPFIVPTGPQLVPRLKAVLETIYLLFNEGYQASSGDQLIKYDLVEEALRLGQLLVDHPAIVSKQTVHALLSLMQLNAARFTARQNAQGHIITLEHQNRSIWDRDLIDRGLISLQQSEPHRYLSKYHILAIISSYHCTAPSFEQTNWTGILREYDRFLTLDNSAIIQLNRSIALAKVAGAAKAIETLHAIKGLDNYYLYYSILAEFHIELENWQTAISSLQKAESLAALDKERVLIRDRIGFCSKKLAN